MPVPVPGRPSGAKTESRRSLGAHNRPGQTLREDACGLRLVEAATAPNTRRAYDSDLKHFLAWGGSLPASPDVVARYLAAHAATHAVATLARRLVAIRRAHALRERRGMESERRLLLVVAGNPAEPHAKRNEIGSHAGLRLCPDPPGRPVVAAMPLGVGGRKDRLAYPRSPCSAVTATRPS